MMKRQISIAFQTDKTPASYISLAKLVNLYDFDVVSVYCDAPYHPSYGPLVLMAPHITRGRLGPAAVSPFRMHPIDIAANTALLASMTKGRVYFGLVRGAWLDDYGIHEPGKPIQGIREAAAIIRMMLSGETKGYQGEVFRIAGHVHAPYPLPDREIPLMIGTWGPKLAELAGEIADEVKIGGSSNPLMAHKLWKNIRRGVERGGRRMQDVGLALGAVTVVDDDRDAARELAKRRLSLYLPVVARLDSSIQFEPDFIQTVQSAVKAEDFTKVGTLIPDDVLEKFAFAGDVDDILRQAVSVFEAGVTRIEFGTPHGIQSAAGIQLLGEKVIPWLRQHYA